jgi:hypothetical protein
MSQQRSELSGPRAENDDDRGAGDVGRARYRRMQEGPARHANQLLGGAKSARGTGRQNDGMQTISRIGQAAHGSAFTRP